MAELLVGGTAIVGAVFVVGSVPTDPTAVSMTLLSPSAVASHPTPTHVSDGVYRHTFQPDEAGVWSYEFVGTGTAPGTVAGSFLVSPSPVSAGNPAYTYDVATSIGKVRLHIDDRDLSAVSPALKPEKRSAIFTDQELQVFLDAQGGSVYRGSAQALTVIANNRSLLVQRRVFGDTTVDYGSLRADLLKSAEALRDLAADIEADGSADAPADAVVPVAYTDFSERQIVINATARNGY